MSNNCTLNGIFACDKFSVGGIKKIWLVPFGDLFNYTYTSDELGKVTSFSALSIPVEYQTLNGEFTEDYNGAGYNNYQHSLSTSFAKLTYQKRNELEKLAGKNVTAIFKDRNGKCWIAGFDRPLKVRTHRATTGGDASLYSISMTGNSHYQVKEIDCFDPTCFASFNGIILRTSTFVIETASTYDFSGLWQIVANDSLLEYSPAQDLDPVNWSNPTIYAQDYAELTALLGNLATSITLSYDGGTDTATITLQSSTDAYDYLTFNGQTSIRSSINDTLNLQFLLTASINTPATTITVTDDTLAVVYSGAPDDLIAGVGLSGTVSNALINISLTYPAGTTFTATVENDYCETKEYTFVLEQLADCTVSTTVAYNYGISYFVPVVKNTTFNLKYQKVVLFYDEWQFNIIADHTEATDDLATFEAAVIAALTSDPNCPIIASSITVTDSFLTTLISFSSTRRNSDVSVQVSKSFGTNDYSYLDGTYARQSNLMQVATSAPSTSYIGIVNDLTTDTLSGIYTDAPDVNDGFVIEPFDDLGNPTVMNDIAFAIGGYTEDEAWTLTVNSDSCPDSSNVIDTAVCFDTAPLSINRRYDRFTLDVSANTVPSLSVGWVFSYTIGATPFNLVVSTVNEQFCNRFTDELSVAIRNTLPLHLGDNPVKVLNFAYDPYLSTFTLELDCSIDVSWVTIEADYEDVAQTLILAETYDITNCEFDPIINPHTGVDWSFNDVDAVAVVQTGEASDAFLRYRNNTQTNFASFNFDSTLVEMIVSLDLGINTGAIYFEFWDSSFNLLETIAMFTPTTSVQVPFASTPTDVAYVSISDSYGAFSFVAWDSTTQSDIDVYISSNKLERNIWGRSDRWKALTPAVFTPSPVITSLLCP